MSRLQTVNVVHAGGADARMIRTAREVNTYKTEWVIEKIKNATLKFENENGRKAKVACMGLAFKPDIDDLRESSALYIAKRLTAELENAVCVEPNIPFSKDGEQRAADIIKNWIRNRGTLEFIGTWEQLYNPHFKVVEFDHFKMSSGLTSFVLSPGKWIERTDAIKENLLPKQLTPAQVSFVYASEADLLNVALFGMTARQWQESNPDLKGNIRSN